MGTQKVQCSDGEWSPSYPTCESIQEPPKSAEQSALEKAIVSKGVLSILSLAAVSRRMLLLACALVAQFWVMVLNGLTLT